MKNLSDAVLQHTDIMNSFKKKTYPKAFLAYKEEYYPIIEAISKNWEEKEETEREAYLREIAEEYIQQMEASLEKVAKNKLAQHSKIDLYKMIQALYTIPMIRDTKLPVAEALAEQLVESWKSAFPKYVYYLGDYETLMEGFDNNRFCYITTAVCETLGRPDDCYELTMFRQFRDGYLRKQPEGEALIERYYQKAPGIIQRIDRLESKNTIYKEIWEEHLQPCLSLIESGEEEACKERYMDMVQSLEKQYQ